MTVQVILDIVPQHIDPVAWAETYDDAHRLLVAHPGRVLGYDWRTIADVALPVHTRSLERDPDEPAARRLCVVGERPVYRDLARYQGAVATLDTLDDILLTALDVAAAAPEPPSRTPPPFPVPSPGCASHVRHGSAFAHPGGGVARVLGDAAAGAPYALPLLGVAMMVESRFPRWAMVHGDIDRKQAEAVRRWTEGVLGRPVALPVRVEAWRLEERIAPRLRGLARMRAVERLLLAAPATKDAMLLRCFGRREAEPWWLGKLLEHAHPTTAGALQLLAAYLKVNADLPRLCVLACLDARGPRYPPDALMEALASLRSEGALDGAIIERALVVVFGAGAGRLLEALKRYTPAPGAPAPSVGLAPPQGVTPELQDLATLPSSGALTPLQRELVRALALLAGEVPAAPAEAALHLLATSIARSGPMLTEDAWGWIASEEDPGLMRFLTALAALDGLSAELGELRRALLENRGLCRYALEVWLAEAQGGAA